VLKNEQYQLMHITSYIFIFELLLIRTVLKRSYGEDPQEHAIKGEMDRIKEQMVRVKQITESSKRPRLNQEATKRIVRHELNIRKKRKTVHEENWENEKKDNK